MFISFVTSAFSKGSFLQDGRALDAIRQLYHTVLL